MINYQKTTYLVFVIITLLFSCSKPENNKTINSKLFEIVPDSISNITFSNNPKENAFMSALNYDYMYNGAGVSVGDVNGDSLPDIFFVSNQNKNELYLNNGALEFKNVSKIAGITGVSGFKTGSTFIDINNDGLLDIYICKSGLYKDSEKRKNELYINQGNNQNGIPTFIEEAHKYKLDLEHYSTQASFFDYDKDGDLDMFLINHNVDSNVHYNFNHYKKIKSDLTSDRLYQNNNNIFKDISKEAGLLNDGIGYGLGIAIGDLNNDTWPDVIVSQDFTSKDRMYLNQKNGTFKEIISTATGHISNFSMGNDIADFNNDGWLDFVSLDMVSEDNYGIKASMSGMNPERFNSLIDQGFHHQYMYNTLQINNGISTKKKIPVFSDVAAMAGVASTDWSWGPLFFDMDNDGDKDLFVSNGIKRDFRNVDYIHYRERKEIEFEEKIKKISKKLRPLFQEQHDADIIKNMPPRKKDNYFYENLGDAQFLKKNGDWTVEKLTATNGASYADLDNDGDLDLITNNMNDKAFIYKNNSRELGLGSYLKIKLKGSSKNINGIGVRVSIITTQGTQILEQYASRGFQSSKDYSLHFGVGKETIIDTLKINWPNGKSQLLTNTKSNQTIILNYKDAINSIETKSTKKTKFQDITSQINLNHYIPQNTFDDFKRESLLPHKMSEESIALAVGDINNDGLDDFFVGGALGFPGALYTQNEKGRFKIVKTNLFINDKEYEDVNATFSDLDKDGDLDLYVVSGGNEHKVGSKYYSDRIYFNQNGVFHKTNIPFNTTFCHSGSIVKPYDFDSDGDLDLFVGSRQTPNKYPFPGSSFLLKNESKKDQIKFSLITNKELNQIGMVTDANWVNIDSDEKKELVIVGEWMPITIFKQVDGKFINYTEKTGLAKSSGWWNTIKSLDIDKDGDMDFIAGNLGLNSKYKASTEAPFEIFSNDFDDSGSLDIVLSYHQNGEKFPLRGRQCSSQQMPFIQKKFPNYHTYASARLEEVYPPEKMKEALTYKANTFATSYIENNGNGTFNIKKMPLGAQQSSVKSICALANKKNETTDFLLFGNTYGFEVETPRQDASFGTYLQKDKNNFYKVIEPSKTGLYISGEITNAKNISLTNNEKGILIVKNNDNLQLIKVNNR
ncbi:VCBS repeat protein [Maribacter vaceletii]|uniref:VCBS repeat protein n=1 Tax=Maribacter vaceletii TaxID=1206816 RepID=A0A495ECP2_9FLAO|nr:FG-GAP-like repeat-containing protein [Maribacter vaceletii]RKR14333.1 VCBS repeat protein [Maribacter vaceletii]